MVSKSKSRSEMHEAEIKRLLKDLGFDHIDGGPGFKIGGRQIDACGVHENTVLFFECTTKGDLRGKFDEFRGKFNEIIKGFKDHELYGEFKNHVPVFAIKYQKFNENLRKRAEENSPKVLLWDNEYVKYFDKLHKTIGEYAKYSLLAESNIEPEVDEYIEIEASAIRFGKNQKDLLFLFFVDPHEFLKYAYVARRQLGGEEFYQRMVDSSRLGGLANHVEKGFVFPNSIVVAFNHDVWKFKTEGKRKIKRYETVQGKLTIRNNYQSSWIIDGQHRLYSFSRTNSKRLLAVSAFANLTVEKQARYFLDINKEAVSVKPDLLWDLLGTISPTSPDGKISRLAKRLRTIPGGFFFDNLKVPSMGGGDYSFANICTTIQKRTALIEKFLGGIPKTPNPYFDSSPDELITKTSNVINRYFLLLQEQIKPEKSEILYRDGFVSVAIRLFELIVIYNRRSPTNKTISNILEPLFEFLNGLSNNEAEKIRNFYASEGGRNDLLRDFIRYIRVGKYKEFASGVDLGIDLVDQINLLEPRLNKIIHTELSSHYGEKWYENPDLFSDTRARDMAIQRAKKQGVSAWKKINFNSALEIAGSQYSWGLHFEPLLQRNGIKNPTSLKTKGNEIWGFRSDRTHQEHPEEERIVFSSQEISYFRSIFDIFDSVFAYAEEELGIG